MARRFSRIEWQKFLDTLCNLGPFTLSDERQSLDIHLEFLDTRRVAKRNEEKEEQFNELKGHWEKYLDEYKKCQHSLFVEVLEDWELDLYEINLHFYDIKKEWEDNLNRLKKIWEEFLNSALTASLHNSYHQEIFVFYVNDGFPDSLNWGWHQNKNYTSFISYGSSKLKPYQFDPQTIMSQVDWSITPNAPYKLRYHPNDVILAAENICLQVGYSDIITGISSKLQMDIEIVADYFLLECKYDAIFVALAISHSHIFFNRASGLTALILKSFYKVFRFTEIPYRELDRIIDRVENDLTDRDIFLHYLIGDEILSHFNYNIFERLANDQPFGLTVGHPLESQSLFFDKVSLTLKRYKKSILSSGYESLSEHFTPGHKGLRQEFSKLYRNNKHLPFIKFMHDNDFTLFEFFLLMLSILEPEESIEVHLEFLENHIFQYICRWENYLEKFYSDTNPLIKVGWAFISYHRNDKAVRFHLKLEKIVEQGLIMPLKDRPGEKFNGTLVYDHYGS